MPTATLEEEQQQPSNETNDSGLGGGPPNDTVVEEEDDNMPANTDYWQERLYKHTDHYDTDAKFWENMGKAGFLEGKMGAREMSFAKGGGLPTVMPLPSGMAINAPGI